MITTLKDFIVRVNELTDVSDAYDLFEDECTEEVRDIIYSISAEEDSPEPFRAAMRKMGYADF
jgi:hypothetical protein